MFCTYRDSNGRRGHFYIAFRILEHTEALFALIIPHRLTHLHFGGPWSKNAGWTSYIESIKDD